MNKWVLAGFVLALYFVSLISFTFFSDIYSYKNCSKVDMPDALYMQVKEGADHVNIITISDDSSKVFVTYDFRSSREFAYGLPSGKLNYGWFIGRWFFAIYCIVVTFAWLVVLLRDTGISIVRRKNEDKV